MIIEDFEKPVVVSVWMTAVGGGSLVDLNSRTHMLITVGMIDSRPKSIWVTGRDEEECFKKADILWEEEKRSLFGPNTHVETVREDEPQHKGDKYGTTED